MRLYLTEMLNGQKKGRHISFHTPGHKVPCADITELPYSDNLYSPRGAIAAAERDAAELLGAARSFFLTDGSTCGVFCMLFCMKRTGAERIAAPVFSHPSVVHACRALGLGLVPIPQETEFGLPKQPGAEEMRRALFGADALLLTSPDYYGFLPPLEEARALCAEAGKPLLIDGAHGGHLRFTPGRYAGTYADLWVDGVHKSLPAMTQGAVVSAKNEEWGAVLRDSVRYFRTTSPSYPILASVEYAVKYPRNEAIERAAEAFKRAHGCVPNDDWTKVLVPFSKLSKAAERYLEARGVYPEWNDGNYLLFYLSPCTKGKELRLLGRYLRRLPRGEVGREAPTGLIPIYSEEA